MSFIVSHSRVMQSQTQQLLHQQPKLDQTRRFWIRLPTDALWVIEKGIVWHAKLRST